MTNAIYPKFKEQLLKGDANAALNSSEGATGVFVALIDTADYTYSDAHQFYSELTGVVGADQEITSKTQVNGTFDGDDVMLPSVSGDPSEAIVLYRKNGGANTTWPLIAYLDTNVTGLPVTPNATDIPINWNAAGIFTI